MIPSTPDTSFVAAPAAPAAANATMQASTLPLPLNQRTPSGGGVFSVLMLLIALVALVLSGLLWQRLEHIQTELATQSEAATEQSEKAKEVADQAESLAQELQARLSVAEVKVSEVSLQRSQLEELMLSVSRSRDDTLVLDIESSIHLAMQQAELTGSGQPVVTALQAAGKRIGKTAQPRLNPLQRAIARDVERIQSSTVTDLPALAMRLDELLHTADDWPLLSAQPTPAPNAKTRKPAAMPSTTKVAVPTPAAAQAMPSNSVRSVLEQGRAWVQWWLAQAWQSTRELVRVSRIDSPDAVLLAPEQSFLLRENLKLRLLNARLALLSRQVPSARADLQAVETSLRKYFDVQSPEVKQAMGLLSDTLAATKVVVLPQPEETLTALSAAAGGR